jgi:hypothetical protein
VPLNPSCVAFSDPHDQDTLCIFALDRSNHLYSFTLRPDHFRRRSVDASLSDVCRVYQPLSILSRHPHRIAALSADQVVITLHDGGLVRISKTKGPDCGWTDSLVQREKLTCCSCYSSLGRGVLQLADMGTRDPESDQHPRRKHGEIWQGQHGLQRGDLGPGIQPGD